MLGLGRLSSFGFKLLRVKTKGKDLGHDFPRRG